MPVSFRATVTPPRWLSRSSGVYSSISKRGREMTFALFWKNNADATDSYTACRGSGRRAVYAAAFLRHLSVVSARCWS